MAQQVKALAIKPCGWENWLLQGVLWPLTEGHCIDNVGLHEVCGKPDAIIQERFLFCFWCKTGTTHEIEVNTNVHTGKVARRADRHILFMLSSGRNNRILLSTPRKAFKPSNSWGREKGVRRWLKTILVVKLLPLASTSDEQLTEHVRITGMEGGEGGAMRKRRGGKGSSFQYSTWWTIRKGRSKAYWYPLLARSWERTFGRRGREGEGKEGRDQLLV